MTEGGMICVVLPGWNLPAGYTVGSSDLLLRLNPAYPDVCADMWWFSPAVVRADATPIPATESQETYLGRSWHRWSRHFNPGQWMAGVDGIESYLALVAKEPRRCGEGVA
jgi:Prokaryotic E2 family E